MDPELTYRDEEWLRERYHGDGLTQPEIASICDTCQAVISEWMSRLGVESRSKSEAFSGEGNPNWSGAKVDYKCDFCGDVFVEYQSVLNEYERSFCSRECADSAHSDYLFSGGRDLVLVECYWCGSEIERRPDVEQKYDKHFCDFGCKSDFEEENGVWSGENSPRWAGGSGVYYGSSWRRMRRVALRRDQHRCQRCFVSSSDIGREPDVHHIVPFRVFGSDNHMEANRLANLVCLCRSCHNFIESEYNPVDWEEFEVESQ